MINEGLWKSLCVNWIFQYACNYKNMANEVQQHLDIEQVPCALTLPPVMVATSEDVLIELPVSFRLHAG